MADPLHVEVVAADREVWSGEASMVLARTTVGDIGILPHHELLLGLLADGVVEVRTTDEQRWVAAVHGGFLSVAGGRVSVLAEFVEMVDELDAEQVRRDLERARAAADDEQAREEAQRAETRLRALEKAR